jgi:hypothetical protein
VDAEQILYEEGGVRVTTTKVQIDGATYPVAGITSVRRESHISPLASVGALMILFGVALLGAGGWLGSACIASGGAFGVGSIVTGLVLVLRARGGHALVLGTAGGDRPALVSDEEELVEGARAAIEQAITLRG